MKELHEKAKVAPLKEGKLESKLKLAIESSTGAIMKEVKAGMPNATEFAKKKDIQNVEPAAPAGANAPPTPALKGDAKPVEIKTEEAVPAGANPPRDFNAPEVKKVADEKTPEVKAAAEEKTPEATPTPVKEDSEVKSAVKPAPKAPEQEPVAKLVQAFSKPVEIKKEARKQVAKAEAKPVPAEKKPEAKPVPA